MPDRKPSHFKLKTLTSAVGALVLLVTALVAWFSLSPSVAWFSSNKEVTANGMAVQTEGLDNIKISVEAYPIKDKNDNTLIFENTPATADQMKILQYDLLDDVHRHMLLKITIPANLTVNIGAYVPADTDFIGKLNPELNNPNPISSIIGMSIVATGTVTEEDVTYPTVDISGITYKQFATVVKGEDQTTVTMTPEFSLGENCTGEVYVLISYRQENIEKISSENLSVTPVGQGFGYYCDFVLKITNTSGDSNNIVLNDGTTTTP